MTTMSLPSEISRALSLGLLLVILLVGYLLFVYPWAQAYPDAVKELRETQMRLLRFRELASQAEAVADEAAAARAALLNSGAFIEGSSDALAAAAMQNRLDAAVEAAGGDLRSVRSQPSSVENGMVRVRLRAQLTTNVHGLKRLLYALETGTPLLFVESLEARARLARSTTRSDTLSVAPDFLVDLSIAGYRLEDVS